MELQRLGDCAATFPNTVAQVLKMRLRLPSALESNHRCHLGPMVMAESGITARSLREVRRAGDSPGVRPGHDSVQGAEATREPRAAEV